MQGIYKRLRDEVPGNVLHGGRLRLVFGSPFKRGRDGRDGFLADRAGVLGGTLEAAGAGETLHGAQRELLAELGGLDAPGI